METSFKTCVFGGFDREDVISYIRKTAEESQKKLEALMEETERLRVRCETAESELSALRTRSAELEQQLADTEVLRAEAERLRTEEETLRRENETLRGPAAQYQSLKDHIADIEISAHRRTEEFRARAMERLGPAPVVYPAGGGVPSDERGHPGRAAEGAVLCGGV